MSDPRSSFPKLVSIAILMTYGMGLSAQVPSARLDSLLREVRTADSSVIARSRIVDSVRRSVVRPVPTVDVRRGALHVRTVPELESRVQVAVDSVAALIERAGGPTLAARVASHVPMIIRDSSWSVFGMMPTITMASDTMHRWSSVTRRPSPGSVASAQIASGLAGIVEAFAVQGVDSALSAWLMVGRIPLRPATVDEANDAYIEVMTAQSAALRRCRAGDAAACLDVLGIDSLPGTRLARWYSPEEYRSLLRAVAPPREDSSGVAAWIQCRENRDEAACRVAAAAIPNERVPIPLSANARLMFVREALALGGPQAYQRLVAPGGTVGERLTRAAGAPLDSTVRRWNARLNRSRPERMRVPVNLAVASLGWSGALIGLTLLWRGPWV
jgi:hypothetical protein